MSSGIPTCPSASVSFLPEQPLEVPVSWKKLLVQLGTFGNNGTTTSFIIRNPSFACWKVRFKSDLLLHQFRVKAALVQPLLDWAINILL
jgi:hypothetical protein